MRALVYRFSQLQASDGGTGKYLLAEHTGGNSQAIVSDLMDEPTLRVPRIGSRIQPEPHKTENLFCHRFGPCRHSNNSWRASLIFALGASTYETANTGEFTPD